MCWPGSPGHIRSMDREVDVLVVDDDPEILALLSGVLIELGLRVATAGDGRTGLDQARRLLPHLVLSDVDYAGRPHGGGASGRPGNRGHPVRPDVGGGKGYLERHVLPPQAIRSQPPRATGHGVDLEAGIERRRGQV